MLGMNDEGLKFEDIPEGKAGTVQVSIRLIIVLFSLVILGVGVMAFLSVRVNSANSSNYNGIQSAELAGGQYAVSGNANGAGGGCGSGGGGCGSSGAGGGCGSGGAPKTADQLNSIKVEAVKYYVQKYGDKSVSAQINDKGCHVEIVILKDNKPIKYLSFKNGQFSELS